MDLGGGSERLCGLLGWHNFRGDIELWGVRMSADAIAQLRMGLGRVCEDDQARGMAKGTRVTGRFGWCSSCDEYGFRTMIESVSVSIHDS